MIFQKLTPKLVPCREVLVTQNSEGYGDESKIDSMVNDGTQSWVVFCRGVEKHVEEFALDHTHHYAGRDPSRQIQGHSSNKRVHRHFQC